MRTAKWASIRAVSSKTRSPLNSPVERPTKIELLVNLKTVATLGLTIPSGVLAIADEVIE